MQFLLRRFDLAMLQVFLSDQCSGASAFHRLSHPAVNAGRGLQMAQGCFGVIHCAVSPAEVFVAERLERAIAGGLSIRKGLLEMDEGLRVVTERVICFSEIPQHHANSTILLRFAK